MLLVETPSGIMADRWSRKGVFLVGIVALGLSALVGGLSHTVPVYILSTLFWGTFAAMYSGTYDAVIYDTVMEEQGAAARYKFHLGHLRIVEGVSYVFGALLGGLLAELFSTRDTYFYSLPLVAGAAFFLLRFREPTLHKAEVAEPVLLHIRQTFAAVLHKRRLLPVVIAIVGFAVLAEVIFEFSQLWLIALVTPLIFYGPISAAVFFTWTLGGMLAQKLKSGSRTYLTLAVALGSILLLIVSRNYGVVALAQVLLGTCLVALGVILSGRLHDELPSRLRAGSSSVVSTLARSILVPFSLIFTAISHNTSIFAASVLLLAIGLVGTLAYLKADAQPRQV